MDHGKQPFFSAPSSPLTLISPSAFFFNIITIQELPPSPPHNTSHPYQASLSPMDQYDLADTSKFQPPFVQDIVGA